VALSYGVADLVGAWGFLAAFAAGLGLRHVEMRRTEYRPPGDRSEVGSEEAAVHPEKAPAHMTDAVLGFNEQVEKVLEVAAVLVLGALLATTRPTWAAAGLAAALFLVVRPASVFVGLAGVGASAVQKGLMGWFGVRGVGSLYYLTYAIGHGLPGDVARTLAELVVWAVALSIVVHGVSVTPVMDWYSSRRDKRADGLPAGPSRTNRHPESRP